MNRKEMKNGEQISQSERPKDQFLLAVVTGCNQQVFLYQIKGFYVEFISNEPVRKGIGAKQIPRQPYQTKKITSPANCRQVTISLDELDLQRFSINMN